MGGELKAAIADEQARNRRYIDELHQKAGGSGVPISVPSSSRWTGSALPRFKAPEVHPVIGRVGLTEPYDAIDDDSFYIGPWRCDLGDAQVFSWAAPIAAAFFGTAVFDDLKDRVQVTRVFATRNLEVVAFDDERFDSGDDPTSLDKRTPLSIPAPPGLPGLASTPATAPRQRLAQVPAQRQAEDPADATPQPEASPKHVAPPLRAAKAVRRALASPKRAAMPNVLGTLQPDQYRLVTWPEDQPLLVQGHPGSGKTIVAVHRAAWLVNPDRGHLKRREPRVLLLGPTSNYVQHTSPTIGLLSSGHVEVRSIRDLMQRVLPDLIDRPVADEEAPQDVDVALGRYVDRVAERMRKRGLLNRTGSTEDRAERVYDAVRQMTERLVGLKPAEEWQHYLSGLPEWDAARLNDRHGPLLAYCALNAAAEPAFTYDHVIVDEAQDMRPLEWSFLAKLNPGGQWTVLGDMNQRRSPWSYATWPPVAKALGLPRESAKPEIFTAVYRSTPAILAFASQLLPTRQRTAVPVQDRGLPPSVMKCRAADRGQAAVEAAERLIVTHSEGTVAIIATDLPPIMRSLVEAGWYTRRAGRDRWMRKRSRLHVLEPKQARGLEFDGVVVVEPASFPATEGTQGVLYTSLTRANKELVVVHARPLPAGLRPPRSRA
jgi:DNA helicase IV